MLDLSEVDGVPSVIRFPVRVQPRSSREELAGVHNGALRVRVHAAPVDGGANDAVVAVIAKALHVARGSVRIVRGERSRSKLIEVRGVTRAQFEREVGLVP